MSERILVIGGYGVFGGRLSLALSQNENFDVIVAGRSEKKAMAFCEGTKCTPATIDTTSADIVAFFSQQRTDIVIDAAGPFQSYPTDRYAIAEAAITCGVHYLDLSDDAEFTRGITVLNEAARRANVTVLSGVSSVPALSSAIVGSLSAGMQDIHLIESAILPGNRAPRGQSVIKAIVGQVGQKMKIWRGGSYETIRAWGETIAISLKDATGKNVARRWASIIGAPDLSLFPDHFKARSVVFKAGLDLKLMHGGLWSLAWLVRLGILKTILPLAGILKNGADVLQPFGSDIGGMIVSVKGMSKSRQLEHRSWILIVRDGDGPSIPTIPAQIICKNLLAEAIETGARPCLEAFTADEAEAALSRLNTNTSTKVTNIKCAFEKVLGPDFTSLPHQLADLHTVIDVRRWSGRASVARGESILSKIAGRLAGFPAASEDIEVNVEMRRTKQGELWIRQFGKNRFRSHLRAKTKRSDTVLTERFGWMTFKIDLRFVEDKLQYPVASGRFLFVPLPSFLLPKSDTHEFVDKEGRACFDVRISLPFADHIASYKGWLEPRD